MPRHIIAQSQIKNLQLDGLSHKAYCAGESKNGRKQLNLHIEFPMGQPPTVHFEIVNKSKSPTLTTVRELPDFTTLEEAIAAYNEV